MEFINLKAQYNELRESINARIQRVLDHGQYIMGPEVKELEDRLSTYTGARHCITVASGTEALLISLMAIGIKPGDEIITTPFSFIAAAEVIVLLGARPVFVDIEEDTCNINASLIEEKITKKTKAIIPVSLYGQPADMDEINAIAHKHDLIVIEDAAQSFGATYKNKRSCNLSAIGCTSFFPSKPLGCYGDGGAIFTSDDNLAKTMQEIRVHGQSKRYVHSRVGVGGRMDTLQCAILLAKFDHFEDEVIQRNTKAKKYQMLLKGHVNFVTQKKDRIGVYSQFAIFETNRQELSERLKTQGIPTSVHYPLPIHKQLPYAIYGQNNLKNSEHVSEKILCLPISPYIEDESIEYIAKTIISIKEDMYV